jgi:hypothetical protein
LSGEKQFSILFLEAKEIEEDEADDFSREIKGRSK